MKFKAYDNKNKRWLSDFNISNKGEIFVIKYQDSYESYGEWIEGREIKETRDATLCLSTGLLDEDNNQIFEGDIIKSNNDFMVVSWHESYASFVLNKNGWLYSHYFGESIDNKNCKIVGNIFDNKELLKEKK